jgi:hypothetical protein
VLKNTDSENIYTLNIEGKKILTWMTLL